MKGSSQEIIIALQELGLTLSEAKVYLALTQIGSSHTGSIAKNTGIYRQHVYHTLNSLNEKGLIEKQLGKIPNYKAIPANEAFSILFGQEQKRISKLKTKVNTITEELEKLNNNYEPHEQRVQFVVVPAKLVIINRLRRALQKAQKSIDVITTRKRLSSAILAFPRDYKNALNRGVKIQIVTEYPVTEQPALKTIQSLSRSRLLKIKYLPPSTPEALVVIFDKKEAYVTTSATADLSESDALWVSNKCFLAILQSYFENKWSTAVSKKRQL
ncbi:MAG: hypothetical protein NWF00_09440 [Candidatus Bathyarchaeota archaeon]|nr:hypothetical protein [Candidatus Bathyarchaeota archaeon]